VAKKSQILFGLSSKIKKGQRVEKRPKITNLASKKPSWQTWSEATASALQNSLGYMPLGYSPINPLTQIFIKFDKNIELFMLIPTNYI